MLTISKPLSAGQAQTYHKEEFAQENYYSEADRGCHVLSAEERFVDLTALWGFDFPSRHQSIWAHRERLTAVTRIGDGRHRRKTPWSPRISLQQVAS